ncbi:MAG: nucleotidyltransferase family protein [Miltoncostaeaceae bacterium]
MTTTVPHASPPDRKVRTCEPIVLAGGRGTRLAPFTAVIPKPLMPIGDESIVDVLLAQIKRRGWDSATLAVGHMAHLLRSYCGDGSRYDLDISYVEEETPLGTVGPLAHLPARHRDCDLLVMNGDLLTDLPFDDLMETHVASEATATIAVQRRPVRMDYGVLDLDEDALGGPQVIRYREKPRLSATVSMGVYAFSPRAIDYIVPGERLDLPQLIDLLLEGGEQVNAYPYEGYWLDIGQPGDYEQAVRDFTLKREEILGPEAAPVTQRAV